MEFLCKLKTFRLINRYYYCCSSDGYWKSFVKLLLFCIVQSTSIDLLKLKFLLSIDFFSKKSNLSSVSKELTLMLICVLLAAKI